MFGKVKQLRRKIRAYRQMSAYEKYMRLFEERYNVWPEARDFVMQRGGVYFPDYNNPRTFQEKLNWLGRMYYKKSPLNYFSGNKATSKIYFSAALGDRKYIVKTYGVYNSPDEIDWNAMPDSFVVKTTMGWRGKNVILVPSKHRFNSRRHRKTLDAMTRSLLDGTPCPIIIEELLSGFPIHGDLEITDYKIFCFDGCATFVRVHSKRASGIKFGSDDKNMSFYSLPNFEKIPVTHNEFIVHPNPDTPRPEKLDEMVVVAETLARGLPIARIDLYLSNGNVYIGELTILGGVGHVIDPVEYDYIWGDMITLPSADEIENLIRRDRETIGRLVEANRPELIKLSNWNKIKELLK